MSNESGYRECSCSDCFEIAIGDYDDETCLCNSCEEAGCGPGEECQAPHAYCSGAETVEVDGEECCEACGLPF